MCQCNGKFIPSGIYKGAGKCDSNRGIDCGAFCFVDKGKCRDEIHLFGLESYGYASCTPCAGTRKAPPPLKDAECPADKDKDSGSPTTTTTTTTPGNGSPRPIGTGIGLLAAGICLSLLLF